MSIWGSLIGGFIGFSFAGPIGALIGSMIGGRISSARFSNLLPADVKRGGLVLRTKSVHSSRSSRSFSWCDKAD